LQEEWLSGSSEGQDFWGQAVPIIRIEDATKFVGMDLVKARAEIDDHGYESRAVSLDGSKVRFDFKRDYDPLRVNLWIENGKVTKAAIG
jgi:hypothetical protein